MERTMTWARYGDASQLGEDFNRFILGDERWDALRDSTKQMLREEGRAFRADMAFQAAPFMELDQLKVPFLVGCGTVAPEPLFLDAHRRVAELTRAELFIGEGADHFAHTNHPEIWVEFVRATVNLAMRSVEPH